MTQMISGFSPSRITIPAPVGRRPATAIVQERVRFGAAHAVLFPIQTVSGAGISKDFSTRVGKAVQLAFKDFEPALMSVMKEQGFKIIVGELPTQGLKGLDDIIPKKEIPRMLRMHRNTLIKFFEAASIQSAQMKKALKEDTVMAQEVFQLLKDNLDRQAGVSFIEGQKGIRIAERINGSGAEQWQQDQTQVETLAALIRQEGARFVDSVVGKAKTGKNYSEADKFKKLVLTDMAQARTNGTLDKVGKNRPNGVELNLLLPIEGVESKDAQFREAFASILAGHYGGGLLNAGEVSALCPESLAYCKKEVPLSLKSWPVRAWVRFWDTVSAIGRWFKNLFKGFFPGKSKAAS